MDNVFGGHSILHVSTNRFYPRISTVYIDNLLDESTIYFINYNGFCIGSFEAYKNKLIMFAILTNYQHLGISILSKLESQFKLNLKDYESFIQIYGFESHTNR